MEGAAADAVICSQHCCGLSGGLDRSARPPTACCRPKGRIPTAKLAAGSYNYFDFSTGFRGAFCHMVADVAPTFWWGVAHG